MLLLAISNGVGVNVRLVGYGLSISRYQGIFTNGTFALTQAMNLTNFEERCSLGQILLGISEISIMTATDPRSLELVKTKEGLLCKSVEFSMMAALSFEKTCETITGMKRDWRFPALLMPTPAILLPSLGMCFYNEEIDHESQSTMGWSGGGCDFKYYFGIRIIYPMDKIKIWMHFCWGSQLPRHIRNQDSAVIVMDLIFKETQKGKSQGPISGQIGVDLMGIALGFKPLAII